VKSCDAHRSGGGHSVPRAAGCRAISQASTLAGPAAARSLPAALVIATAELRQIVEGALLVNEAADIIGATLIAATAFACYRYSDRVLRVLGETGTNVRMRQSAVILICTGVQIFWNGAAALPATVTALHPC
jgi:small neutral amino acid transporter SnatA (MarC family)